MSDSSTLKFFTESAVEDIAHHLDVSETAGDLFDLIDAMVRDSVFWHELEWSLGAEIPDLDAESDAKSAIALHRYLGRMTPVQASDRRLWTWLSCVDFRDYTSARWPLDREGWKRRFRDRWALSGARRETLTRNAISRLWRAADLVYDPELLHPLSREQQDPYAYVWPLLQKQDRFVSMMERDISSTPSVLFALLDAFHQYGDQTSEKHAREIMKEVLLVAGYRELATLSDAAVAQEVGNITRLVDQRLLALTVG